VDGDGISNGCSTIGISKTTPIEIIEQRYPVLIERYALHEGSGGPGTQRGGFGVTYKVKLRRGSATASFVMDHGRSGPLGALGGRDGGVNKVVVIRNGTTYHPPHLSKDQGIAIEEGDTITVSTPGGGGFGDPLLREPARVARDVKRGYFTVAEAEEGFGVVLDSETLTEDEAATRARRGRSPSKRGKA
jgi:N-methylhydantoinase B